MLLHYYSTEELKEIIKELAEKAKKPTMKPWQITCLKCDIDRYKDEINRRAGK